MLKILILSFLLLIFSNNNPGYGSGLGYKNPDYKNIPTVKGSNIFFYRSNIIRVSGTNRKVAGIPKVTDGDSIRIGDVRIRLFGIDAPESRQKCSYQGEEWRCGWESTNALANIIGQHWVTCLKRSSDRYGRVVAICKVGPIDLSAWMVVNGWALAYKRYSKDYVDEEEIARTRRKGVWRGHFMKPWEWRRSR